MRTTSALAVLDIIRQADQAATAHTTAERALAKAMNATIDAGDEAAQIRRRLARAVVWVEDPEAHALIEQLLQQLADAEQRVALRKAEEEKAHAREQRARAKADRARRLWRSAYLAHGGKLPDDIASTPDKEARAAAAAAILGPLAAAPLELIRAAHAILIQSSGGKDSVVMLHRIVQWARAAGCLHKLVVVHADLGEAEWPGVRELAQRQAERYGLPFIVVKHPAGFISMVEKRGLWPSPQQRLCTATLKRQQAAPIITQVVDALGLDEQAIVLNCMGVRAAESAARALKAPLSLDVRSSSAKRLVLIWNAIFEFSDREVWESIAEAGLEYHFAYDADLPRLSCVFCIMAGRPWLIRAARLCFVLGLDTPATYVQLEQQIHHTFLRDLSLEDIVAEARRLDEEEGPLTWQAGDAISRHLGEEAAADYLRRLALTA